MEGAPRVGVGGGGVRPDVGGVFSAAVLALYFEDVGLGEGKPWKYNRVLIQSSRAASSRGLKS